MIYKQKTLKLFYEDETIKKLNLHEGHKENGAIVSSAEDMDRLLMYEYCGDTIQYLLSQSREFSEFIDYMCLDFDANKDFNIFCKKFQKKYKYLEFEDYIEFYLKLFNIATENTGIKDDRFPPEELHKINSHVLFVLIISFTILIDNVFGRKKIKDVKTNKSEKYIDIVSYNYKDYFLYYLKKTLLGIYNKNKKSIKYSFDYFYEIHLTILEDSNFNIDMIIRDIKLKYRNLTEKETDIVDWLLPLKKQCLSKKSLFKNAYLTNYIERKVSEILTGKKETIRSYNETFSFSITSRPQIYDKNFTDIFKKREDLSVLRADGVHILVMPDINKILEIDLFEKMYNDCLYIIIIQYRELYNVNSPMEKQVMRVPLFTILNITQGFGIGDTLISQEELYAIFKAFGIEYENLYDVYNLDFETVEFETDYIGLDIGGTMTCREETELMKDNMINECDVVIQSPAWFKYKGLNHKERVKNKEKTRRDYVRVKDTIHVSPYVRKLPKYLDGTRRENALDLADKYCIDLKDGYTIVEEFSYNAKQKRKERKK